MAKLRAYSVTLKGPFNTGGQFGWGYDGEGSAFFVSGAAPGFSIGGPRLTFDYFDRRDGSSVADLKGPSITTELYVGFLGVSEQFDETGKRSIGIQYSAGSIGAQANYSTATYGSVFENANPTSSRFVSIREAYNQTIASIDYNIDRQADLARQRYELTKQFDFGQDDLRPDPRNDTPTFNDIWNRAHSNLELAARGGFHPDDLSSSGWGLGGAPYRGEPAPVSEPAFLTVQQRMNRTIAGIGANVADERALSPSPIIDRGGELLGSAWPGTGYDGALEMGYRSGGAYSNSDFGSLETASFSSQIPMYRFATDRPASDPLASIEAVTPFGAGNQTYHSEVFGGLISSPFEGKALSSTWYEQWDGTFTTGAVGTWQDFSSTTTSYDSIYAGPVDYGYSGYSGYTGYSAGYYDPGFSNLGAQFSFNNESFSGGLYYCFPVAIDLDGEDGVEIAPMASSNVY